MTVLDRIVETISPAALRRLTGAAVVFVAAAAAGGSTITVNSTADVAANDGQCTLREAIIAANTNTASGAAAGECAAGAAGLDTIAFNIPGPGVHAITLASNLPLLTEPVIIDGYTQPANGGAAASPNTNAFPGPLNTVLLIELVKTTASFSIDAAGSTVRGLIIHGSSDNIIVNADNVTIRGNFLGTNAAGTAAANASAGDGIFINTGNNTVIGGPNPADRNLICSNGASGVNGGLAGVGITIQGNFIGTDVTGTSALVLLGGQGLRNMSNATITGNLISGNADGGIATIATGAATNNIIQGNLIGTQRDGVSALGNANFGGVVLEGDNNTIGGAGAGQPNVIAFNTGFGVDVISNGNPILSNSIHGNTFKGIALNGLLTPLANDNCDVDPGPGNGKQNYPVITSAPIAAGSVTISGTFNSAPSTTFRLEFFSNAVCDAAGNGQGQTFIGTTNVTTDAGCNATFGPLVFPVSPGQAIFTATATDPGNNTSEFSACFPLGVPATATPTPTNTATPTPTSTPAGVPTATPTPAPVAVAVPTLSPGMLVLLALGLGALAVLLLRRT